jgi:hypothetical protein
VNCRAEFCELLQLQVQHVDAQVIKFLYENVDSVKQNRIDSYERAAASGPTCGCPSYQFCELLHAKNKLADSYERAREQALSTRMLILTKLKI